MEKSLFVQMGGTYRRVGDYYIPNLSLPDNEDKLIGIWGQRHRRYLKQSHKIRYMNLFTSGKLNAYHADIDEQADEMFFSIGEITCRKRRSYGKSQGWKSNVLDSENE